LHLKNRSWDRNNVILKSKLKSENKQEEYLKKIEAEFKSTLEKRFTDIENKFTGESKDKRITKPRILGVDKDVIPVEKNSETKTNLSPSPTVEEIKLEVIQPDESEMDENDGNEPNEQNEENQ